MTRVFLRRLKNLVERRNINFIIFKENHRTFMYLHNNLHNLLTRTDKFTRSTCEIMENIKT